MEREHWIDNTKVLACILVVLGHFFQSMVKSSIMVDTDLYKWFNQTIYYFHVSLFFICSGYLYQKKHTVVDLKTKCHFMINKMLSLGIPYFVFLTITWIMKNMAVAYVNTETDGLINCLLINPIPPYWYLYTLFFLFLFIPNLKTSHYQMVCVFLAALILKMISCFWQFKVFVIGSVMGNSIWFVVGMVICLLDIHKLKRNICLLVSGMFFLIIFILLSLVVYQNNINDKFVGFSLAILADIGIISTIYYLSNKQFLFLKVLSRYTMPVFLMHTIFAAAIRIILLKLNIYNLFVHIILGLILSFIGPTFAAIVLEKLKLDFIIYPHKYIKLQR